MCTVLPVLRMTSSLSMLAWTTQQRLNSVSSTQTDGQGAENRGDEMKGKWGKRERGGGGVGARVTFRVLG